jgi:Ion channel
VRSVREEVTRLTTWGNRHRLLVFRLTVIFVLTLAVDAVGTTLIYFLERHASLSEVHSVFDAFFFTTVQLLTVSSQLKNPVTTGGRIVDIFLEIWAVLVVAGSAGTFASFIQAGDEADGNNVEAPKLELE